MNILNVKYLISFWDVPGTSFDKIYDENGIKIYKNQKALPVFFVSREKDNLNLLMSQSSWSRKTEYDFMTYKASVKLKKTILL